MKRWRWSSTGQKKGEAKSAGLLGNAADIFPQLVKRRQAGSTRPDIVTDQTSVHGSLNGYLPQDWTVAKVKDMRETDPMAVEKAARVSMKTLVAAMVDFWTAGVPTLDYSNNIRRVALDEGLENAVAFPGRGRSGLCSGFVLQRQSAECLAIRPPKTIPSFHLRKTLYGGQAFCAAK